MMSYFLTHSPEKTDSDGVKDADRREKIYAVVKQTGHNKASLVLYHSLRQK